MQCPKCGGKTEVTHSRSYPEYIRRRRVCKQCGEVMTTYETLKPLEVRYPIRPPRVAKPKPPKPPKLPKPKKEPKPKPKPCGFNPGIMCAEGNRCATCGWGPIKRKEDDGKWANT